MQRVLDGHIASRFRSGRAELVKTRRCSAHSSEQPLPADRRGWAGRQRPANGQFPAGQVRIDPLDEFGDDLGQLPFRRPTLRCAG